MSVLTGLKAVDWVVPFSELTPGRLIRNLNPNILVKSDKNYRNIEENLDLEGVKYVLDKGGKVHLISRIHDISSTKILRKINNSTDK